MDLLLALFIRLLVFLAHFSRPLSRLHIASFDAWKPGKKRKLLLVGYNGARNTGADARVVAIVRQLKTVFDPEDIAITVMTLNKDSLEGYFDPDVTLLEFSSVFLFDLFKACSSHHAAILCEGSTLKSTFANALTMFFCEASGIMKNQHKPCIAFGSEIGHMEEFLEKLSKDLCDDTYFITRTDDSTKNLRALGLPGHTGTDTAWFYDQAIPKEEAHALLREAGWDGKKELLGLAVIDPFCWPVRSSLLKWIRGILSGNMSHQYDKWYFFSVSDKRRQAFYHYIDEIAKTANAFIKAHDAFPVIIGMERLDKEACDLLKSKLNTPSALFWSGDTDAGKLSGILRSLSILITSRYHAAVLSMETAIPILAVTMDERLLYIFKELSFHKKYLFKVSDKELSDKLYPALEQAYLHKEEIKEHINEGFLQYRKKQLQMGIFLKQYLTDRL